MNAVGSLAVQLTPAGTRLALDDDTLTRLAAEFRARQCLQFPQFFSAELIGTLLRRIDDSAFEEKENEGVGIDQAMEKNAAFHALHLAMSDPQLLDAVERITGVTPLRSFAGRVYRMLPNTGHALDWHDDGEAHRLIAVTVNLTPTPFAGGVFQLRKKGTATLLREVHNTGLGDAVMFRVAPSLEHRVTALEGATVRTAVAGWFTSLESYWNEIGGDGGS